MSTKREAWDKGQEATASILSRGSHIHLVGIGGSGLSAIARVLLERGFTVSGSDRQLNEQTAALAALGATIYEGHRAEQIGDAEAVLISSAVAADNPEVVAARSRQTPVLKRGDFLAALSADELCIAVAGTHGKTTTTGMIAQILLEAGLDPTVVVGGVLPSLGTNGRAGQGGYFVVEADEYDEMFLGLRPDIAVVTSIEHDHPDLFPTAASYEAAFKRFASLLPNGGRLVACHDDAGVRRLLAELGSGEIELITYGLESRSPDDLSSPPAQQYRALDRQTNPLGGSDFVVERAGSTIGLARLRLPGEHNVQNALAATAVAMALEIGFGTIQQALMAFGGMARRFQVTGEFGGVTFIDDYAHHPTEIRATLAAARQRYPGRRLWAVWQPHTFSRTKLLLEAFAASFGDADRVIALDIYRSREQDSLGMDSADVVAEMAHPGARHIGERADAAAYLVDRVRPGDVVLTLGAGDGNLVGQLVLEGLKRQRGVSNEI